MHFDIFDFKETNGLVFCDKPEKAKNNAERIYISEVKNLKAQAVFFRRFFKEEDSLNPYNSEPAVIIFREEDFPFNSNEHKKLHASLWSSGKNEIYILLGKSRIDIINARKPADVKNNTLDISDLRLVSEVINDFNNERFSAYLFGTGTFWEQTEFKDKIDEKSSPYIYLLDYLMMVRKEFLSKKEIRECLEPHTIDKLLIVSILVKFLEEIKDDHGKHTLRAIYKNWQVDDFAEAIKKGLLLDVLADLAVEFNGKIFDMFSQPEKQNIEEANLSLLALFFQANIDFKTKQYFLWEQYNFQHLPAEVISAIYENFIQAESARTRGKAEKGVVYTPIHLVNFLIDEVMPLDKPELFTEERFRVLDPSCGSGVFLVAAYKRLLQWWAINNSEPGNINYPNSRKALEIMMNNIYGVDVKETATLVSIFGLTTALLDKLSPKEIWNNLRFKDLREENIIHKSFFEWAINVKLKIEKFDLVVGNPPFNPETDKRKDDVLNPEVIGKLEFKHKRIPGGNFALHFFEGAMTLTNKLCLIIPSNILLYNKASQAQKYRESIFTDFTISNIYDFTHLRRDLFHKSADTPVLAVIAENKPSDFKPITHTIVKREISSEKKIRFEIDCYDIHSVPFNWAVEEDKQFVWKTNLLGGGRLFHLINKLCLYNNFNQFISDKKAENSEWTYSVGYKLNGSKKKPDIDYVYGKDSIITETFNDDECFETFVESNSDFAEPRDPLIYKPPHLIFKVNLGRKNIPIHYSEEYLCFKDKLVGLHSPEDQKEILKDIYAKFKNIDYYSFSKFWILSTSAESMINLETACKKEDIDSLPFIIDENIHLTDFEGIIKDDVLNYYIHLGKSISKNGAGSELHQKVTKPQLYDFASVYCQVLNSVYAQNEKSWQAGKIYQNQFYTVYEFGFGRNNELESGFESILNEEIKSIIEDKISNKGAVYKRVIRIYKHLNGFDCVYLLKPNSLRYWLKSIALRDADDTFMDLKKEGY
jgi:hypothetical protein